MARIRRPSSTDTAHEDNWHGGFYELAIKLGPADDSRLHAALTALWDAADLPEPFRRHAEARAEVSAEGLLAGHLHSIATIPGLGSTLCAVIVVREESWEAGATRLGPDWLDLCLPLGALGNLDERVFAHPFSIEATKGWREPIEQWFATVAASVFEAVPFVHAIAGEEVSGIEPEEADHGHFAVYQPDSDGTLRVEPVRAWSW